MTIEALARITKGGFERVDKRLAEIDRGFAESDKKTDEKIDGLAGATKRGFDDVYKRFDAVYKRFDDVDSKFTQNEREHREIKEEIHEKFDEILTGQDKIVGMLEDRKTGRRG